MTTLFDAETEKRFRARVDTLKPDAPARWGRMNARQMVCHLTDSFRVALGEVPVVPKWTPLRLYPLRWLFVYTLPIPKGKVPTTPEFQATKPGEWEKDVAEWNAALDRFVKRSQEKEPRWGTHPAFGDLGTEEWGARRPSQRPPPDAVRGLLPCRDPGLAEDAGDVDDEVDRAGRAFLTANETFEPRGRIEKAARVFPAGSRRCSSRARSAAGPRA